MQDRASSTGPGRAVEDEEDKDVEEEGIYTYINSSNLLDRIIVI